MVENTTSVGRVSSRWSSILSTMSSRAVPVRKLHFPLLWSKNNLSMSPDDKAVIRFQALFRVEIVFRGKWRQCFRGREFRLKRSVKCWYCALPITMGMAATVDPTRGGIKIVFSWKRNSSKGKFYFSKVHCFLESRFNNEMEFTC